LRGQATQFSAPDFLSEFVISAAAPVAADCVALPGSRRPEHSQNPLESISFKDLGINHWIQASCHCLGRLWALPCRRLLLILSESSSAFMGMFEVNLLRVRLK